jgi:uncharacterized protein YraI
MHKSVIPDRERVVPQGRHREEPVRRSRPRLPRLPHLPRQLARPVVAAGLGATLLGGTLAVVLWPHSGPAPATRAVAAADDGRRDGLAADALQAAAALRAEERSGRDRTRTTPVAQTPSDVRPKPAAVPAVVGKLWATADVNIRSGPSAAGAAIGRLKAGTQADVTGVTQNGWTQVVSDKHAGWVKSSYLSKSKPKPSATSAPAGVSNAPCSKSSSIEAHLTSNARAVYRAVCAAYGSAVSSFGGYRAGSAGDHGTGRAVDIMVSGDPGTVIARYVQAHYRELHVTYVIYQQRIWLAGDPTSQWKAMEDRGSVTANHFDHVHVSVS